MKKEILIGLITDNIDAQSAGISSYARNLSENLLKLHQNILFIHKKPNEFYKEKKEIIINPSFLPIIYSIRKILFTPLFLKDKGIYLLHDTYHFAPFLLWKRDYKKVVTIHDIVPIKFPKSHRLISVLAHKFLLNKILLKSDRIITDSYNTKRDLVETLKIPEDKIIVVHLAASKKYSPLNKGKYQKVLKKYCLSKKYILGVGTLEPRKNLVGLIKAFSKIKTKGFGGNLVLIGKKGWKYKEIFETIKTLNLEKDIIFTGYVPEEDLPALYNGASVFVYPSFYEGFGLPPLEAMACGCPVITSNTSSLPEVVGDAGIMVDPNNVDELAKQIERVLSDEKLRKSMIKKGLAQAKKFSWEKCAKETLDVYGEVLKNG